MLQDGLDLVFRLDIYLVVVFRGEPIFLRLPVLAHHDDRRRIGRLEAHDQIEEPWNWGNLDVIDEAYARDYVFHPLWPHALNPRTMEEHVAPGFAEVKRLTAFQRAAFTNPQVTIDHMVAEGDRVMYQATFRGAHTGPLFGVAPTGKQVTYTEFSVLRIAEGKIAEEWSLWDRLGCFQQLGMVADTRTLVAQAKRAA